MSIRVVNTETKVERPCNDGIDIVLAVYEADKESDNGA